MLRYFYDLESVSLIVEVEAGIYFAQDTKGVVFVFCLVGGIYPSKIGLDLIRCKIVWHDKILLDSALLPLKLCF